MIIRTLYHAFNPVYLKPRVMASAVQHLIPVATAAYANSPSYPRQERRQGERRQRQQKVLLDTRSPYSRRCATGRRSADQQASCRSPNGIDTFA